MVSTLEAFNTSWIAMVIFEADAHLTHECKPYQPPGDRPSVEVFRHWPGPGSWSIKLVLNSKFRANVKSWTWKGRSVGICLRGTAEDGTYSYFCVASHLPPDKALTDGIGDAAALLKSKPRGSVPILVGDLNVDYLPIDTYDPWREFRVHDNHQRRRATLDQLLERFSMRLLPPADVGEPPPGPFREQFRQAYFTRIPIGDQNALPARIDSAAVPADVSDCHLCINWKDVPADHAWLGLTLPPVRRTYSELRRAQTWRPKNSETLTSDVVSELPQAFAGINDLESYCLDVQAKLGDGLSRNQRRKLREPFEIKTARHHLSSSSTSSEYRHRQNILFKLRRNFIEIIEVHLLARWNLLGISFSGI